MIYGEAHIEALEAFVRDNPGTRLEYTNGEARIVPDNEEIE